MTNHNAFPDRLQIVKLNYFPETDSLYIDLSESISVESREISEGVMLDYDKDGNLTGIDIDNASHNVDLEHLTVSRMPGTIEIGKASKPTSVSSTELAEKALLLRRRVVATRLDVEEIKAGRNQRRECL